MAMGKKYLFRDLFPTPKRLEVDLGLRTQNTQNTGYVNAAYQWVEPIEDQFKWYIGPATGIRFNSSEDDQFFALGMGAQIGFDYDFMPDQMPIQLCFNLRPLLNLVKTSGTVVDPGIGVSIRVLF